MMKLFDIIINAIFPKKCISCGTIIERDESLCEYCYIKIERVDFAKVCKRCGLPKKKCECSKRVFHFNAITSPFYNTGIAQAAMYRFKFKRILTSSEFFAWEMAKAVKNTYYDTDIDGIVYVPMHFLKRLKRGFNQSEELAKKLSDILDIKLYDGVLSVKYKNKKQHSMTVKERFNNVKGLYSFNKKVTGKNILLVDDIKTTGATVDECAKQLLLAGADNVYCVTGLITSTEDSKNTEINRKKGK